MSPSAVLRLRVALCLAGIAIWATGIRSNYPALVWTGIALMAAAVLARFFGPRYGRRGPPPEG